MTLTTRCMVLFILLFGQSLNAQTKGSVKTTGTCTSRAGINKVERQLWGAGGNGGTSIGSKSGGGVAYNVSDNFTVSRSTTDTLVFGDGGAGVSGTKVGEGTNTSVVSGYPLKPNAGMAEPFRSGVIVSYSPFQGSSVEQNYACCLYVAPLPLKKRFQHTKPVIVHSLNIQHILNKTLTI